jgi:hypothetical protein
VIYAYGIAEPTPGLPPRRSGIAGTTLEVLETSGMAVVYSRVRSLRASPSPELVLEHERVLEAVMEHAPVLPLRFGTRLDSTDQLAEAIAGRRDALRSALDRVRGRVELGVRVVERATDQDRSPSPTSGRDYLMSVAAAHRRKARVADDIHRPLQDLAADSVVRERSMSPALLVASYLVDTRDVDGFHRAADQLAAAHPDLDVTVTGPWPPYSFTGEDAA